MKLIVWKNHLGVKFCTEVWTVLKIYFWYFFVKPKIAKCVTIFLILDLKVCSIWDRRTDEQPELYKLIELLTMECEEWTREYELNNMANILNTNFATKSKMLVKNLNFGQKRQIWAHIFAKSLQHFSNKNRNFGQRSRFWSKIKRLVEDFFQKIF